MARKRKSKPTTGRRAERQNLKDRYAHAREDAQLAGLIPTVPEEALRSERVDPATQEDQRIDELDREAAAKGWGSSERVKRRVVNVIAEIFFEEPQTMVTADGREVVIPPDRQTQIKAANALLTADQREYERQHPKEAGQAKGGGAQVNVSLNFFELVARAAAVDVVDEAELKIAALEQRVPVVVKDEST